MSCTRRTGSWAEIGSPSTCRSADRPGRSSPRPLRRSSTAPAAPGRRIRATRLPAGADACRPRYAALRGFPPEYQDIRRDPAGLPVALRSVPWPPMSGGRCETRWARRPCATLAAIGPHGVRHHVEKHREPLRARDEAAPLVRRGPDPRARLARVVHGRSDLLRRLVQRLAGLAQGAGDRRVRAGGREDRLGGAFAASGLRRVTETMGAGRGYRRSSPT